jgi:hypothetical protein
LKLAFQINKVNFFQIAIRSFILFFLSIMSIAQQAWFPSFSSLNTGPSAHFGENDRLHLSGQVRDQQWIICNYAKSNTIGLWNAPQTWWGWPLFILGILNFNSMVRVAFES